ncbi:MAG: hypothetical protein WD314_07510 [Trueperaceae bacterium]
MHNLLASLLLLTSLAIAQDELRLEGRLPAVVPDGAEVVARAISDAGVTAPTLLAVARVDDNRFELRLPAAVDPGLLEEERMGCDEEDVLDLAYLPYLLVEQEGEVVGRLLLTDLPRQLWNYGTPARHGYFLYTPAPFTAEGKCGPGEISVSFDAGWNPVLVIAGADGMVLTDEDAPQSFGWHFDPQQ